MALLSLSLFTLVRALVALDAEELAGRFPDRTPVRGVGAFLWLIGGMLGLMELAQVVPALLAGQVPDVVLKTGHPTGVIYILDLGLVVPLLLLAGRWLRQRRPSGTSPRPSCWSRASPSAWRCWRPTCSTTWTTATPTGHYSACGR